MPLQPCTVITGASTGIGHEIALLAAAEGHVMLIARNREALQKLADAIAKKGHSASVLAIDLALEKSGEAVETFLAQGGFYCDTLVANAGFGHIGYAQSINRNSQLSTLDVNIRSVTDLCLRFLPGMIERGSGRILAVSSIASASPGPGMAVYYASKSYVRMFSEALWQETRGTGVVVSCLCPGPVKTPFLEKSGIGETLLFKIVPPKGPKSVALEAWQGLKAGRRLIIPGLTAKLVFFLGKTLPRVLLLPWLLKAHVGAKSDDNQTAD